MYLESNCWLFMTGLTSLIWQRPRAANEVDGKDRAEAGMLGGSKAWTFSPSSRTPSKAFQEGPRLLVRSFQVPDAIPLSILPELRPD